MKIKLDLEYHVGTGWLSPWVEGLRNGEAIASTCSRCNGVHFPPLRVCPSCEEPADGWRTLPGAASILYRTVGSDSDFALVQFDGATCKSVVQSSDLSPDSQRCRLIASTGTTPQVCVGRE